jgi:hypothetical protein
VVNDPDIVAPSRLAIIINVMLARRKMSVTELAEKFGITLAKLSGPGHTTAWAPRACELHRHWRNDIERLVRLLPTIEPTPVTCRLVPAAGRPGD